MVGWYPIPRRYDPVPSFVSACVWSCLSLRLSVSASVCVLQSLSLSLSLSLSQSVSLFLSQCLSNLYQSPPSVHPLSNPIHTHKRSIQPPFQSEKKKPDSVPTAMNDQLGGEDLPTLERMVEGWVRLWLILLDLLGRRRKRGDTREKGRTLGFVFFFSFSFPSTCRFRLVFFFRLFLRFVWGGYPIRSDRFPRDRRLGW